MCNKGKVVEMEKITIERPTSEELRVFDIDMWDSWGCEVSIFDWEYPAKERAYILEGKVVVKTDVEEVVIQKGDLVTFPKGLKCTWTVSEPIRKVYSFIG